MTVSDCVCIAALSFVLGCKFPLWTGKTINVNGIDGKIVSCLRQQSQ